MIWQSKHRMGFRVIYKYKQSRLTTLPQMQETNTQMFYTSYPPILYYNNAPVMFFKAPFNKRW